MWTTCWPVNCVAWVPYLYKVPNTRCQMVWKTTTCEEFAKSALYMADPDTKEANVKMADLK